MELYQGGRLCLPLFNEFAVNYDLIGACLAACLLDFGLTSPRLMSEIFDMAFEEISLPEVCV